MMELFSSPKAYYNARGIIPDGRNCNQRVVGLIDYWSAGPMCRWVDSRTKHTLHIAFIPRPFHRERLNAEQPIALDTNGELVATEIVRDCVRGVRIISAVQALGEFELRLQGYQLESDYLWVLSRAYSAAARN